MLQGYPNEDVELFFRFKVAQTQGHSLSLGQFPVPYTVSVGSGHFLNFRVLRCRLVSLTSILND